MKLFSPSNLKLGAAATFFLLSLAVLVACAAPIFGADALQQAEPVTCYTCSLTNNCNWVNIGWEGCVETHSGGEHDCDVTGETCRRNAATAEAEVR